MIARGTPPDFADSASPATRTANSRSPRTLVCIPCYNSEGTILEVLRPLLRYTDADVLLIDDHSDQPLEFIVREAFPHEPRITVQRPREKVFSGGGKNIGLQLSMDEDYDFAVMIDSDIIVGPESLRRMQAFLTAHPDEIVVAPAILPFGGCLQYADTLINFSNYLPDPSRDVSRKECLAGYTFAINVAAFRRSPCQMPRRIGGDDVLFFRRLQAQFDIDSFPLLNHASVVHKPPRTTLEGAKRAQQRYGKAYFSHNQDLRNAAFNKLPILHLLTPRFMLMLSRLFRYRRFRDLLYAPICWYLDFRRAVRIFELYVSGFQDPMCGLRPQADLTTDSSWQS